MAMCTHSLTRVKSEHTNNGPNSTLVAISQIMFSDNLQILKRFSKETKITRLCLLFSELHEKRDKKKVRNKRKDLTGKEKNITSHPDLSSSPVGASDTDYKDDKNEKDTSQWFLPRGLMIPFANFLFVPCFYMLVHSATGPRTSLPHD